MFIEIFKIKNIFWSGKLQFKCMRTNISVQIKHIISLKLYGCTEAKPKTSS